MVASCSFNYLYIIIHYKIIVMKYKKSDRVIISYKYVLL